jgi:hypothetical protein
LSRDATEAYEERVESCFRKGLRAAQARGLVAGSPLVRRLSEGLFTLTLQRAERLARADAMSAIRQLERARNEAPEPGLWIAAQLQILHLLEAEGRDLTAELALLAKTQGEAMFTFPDDAGRIPAAAYALWRGISGEKAPVQKAQRCQELLERYPDLVIAGERVDELAVRTLQQLIAKHGPSIYAPIEARAQAALARVQGEHSSEALRWIADTYPHSDAARAAMVGLLDEALKRGEHVHALQLYAQASRAGRADGRHVRRAIVAAGKVGNGGLAARLTALALERWPQVASDYPADGGKPLSAVLKVDAVAPAGPAVLPKVPRSVVARLDAPSGGIGTQTIAETTVVAGFTGVTGDSLYIVEGSEKLRCFDLSRGGRCFDEARFEAPFAAPMDHPQLWQTGSRLLLIESGRVRSLDVQSGREEWSLDAPERRTLRCLGFQDGLAALWSEARDVDDGGQVGCSSR